MPGSPKPHVPSVPEPNVTDDITNHVQELISNVTNVLRHYAIEMAQRYQEMEMDLYLWPVLLGIISGSIIAVMTHQLALRMKTDNTA